jgi:hypothetical protein
MGPFPCKVRRGGGQPEPVASRSHADDPIALDELLEQALEVGDDTALRTALIERSGLPGPRFNLRLVTSFARAVGAIVVRPDPAVAALEKLLDGWAALSPKDAPGDRPAVILPCAAHAAYGEVGAVRPDWWSDEMTKLRRGAADPRWRVREVVAQALQRLLDADWSRTVEALDEWAADDHPLVVRAAAASVAEPPLLRAADRARSALDVQRRAVDRYRSYPTDQRRSEGAKVLRQALGFTVGVAVAATGDFTLLEDLAASSDRDLRWIVRQNLGKSRLNRWPDQLAHLHQLLTR